MKNIYSNLNVYPSVDEYLQENANLDHVAFTGFRPSAPQGYKESPGFTM